MAWTFNDFYYVDRELRLRLFHHRLNIEYGHYPDLAAAVAAQAERDRAEHLAAVAQVVEKWHRKQAAKPLQQWRHHRRIVLERSPHCTYCDAPATSADHVIPWCRGGTNDLSNLVSACRRCNSMKHDRTPDEWRQERLARGLSWPPRLGPSGSQGRLADGMG